MIQKINFRFSALAVLCAMIMISASAPVYAREGSDDASGTSASGRKSAANTQVKSEAETETEKPGDDNPHRKAAAGLVTELRKEHKTQSAEARQKKCQSRKQGLNTKFNRMVTNSQRAQDRITGVLDKAMAYQKDNNLQVNDFDTLAGKANAAAAVSADSITALKAVKPTLDCNNASVAQDVATFKTAAQDTRDKLKAYRSAVKDLLKALEAAKPSTTEGSNQ
jgi:hypothetical protein